MLTHSFSIRAIKNHIMSNLPRGDVPKTNEFIDQVIGDAPYGNNFNVVLGTGADNKPIAFTGLTKIYYDALKSWKANIWNCRNQYNPGISPAPRLADIDYPDRTPMLWVDKLDQCIKPSNILAAEIAHDEKVNSYKNELDSRKLMLEARQREDKMIEESRRLEDEKIRGSMENDAPPPYVEMPPPPYAANPAYEESKSNAQKR